MGHKLSKKQEEEEERESSRREQLPPLVRYSCKVSFRGKEGVGLKSMVNSIAGEPVRRAFGIISIRREIRGQEKLIKFSEDPHNGDFLPDGLVDAEIYIYSIDDLHSFTIVKERVKAAKKGEHLHDRMRIPFRILGNKADNEVGREVTERDVEEFLEKEGLPAKKVGEGGVWGEVSVVDDPSRIEKIVIDLAEEYFAAGFDCISVKRARCAD